MWSGCGGSPDKFIEQVYQKLKKVPNKFGFEQVVAEPIERANPAMAKGNPFGQLTQERFPRPLPRPGEDAVPDKIRYKQCRTLVARPSDWRPELARRSEEAPAAHLILEHAHGWRPPHGGAAGTYVAPNLRAAGPPGAARAFAFATASTVVVQPAGPGGQPAGPQRFFHAHEDDVSCLALDPSGEIAASGQVGLPCYICVWLVDDCSLFGKFGEELPPFTGQARENKTYFYFERQVVQVGFSSDSQLVMGIGGDNHHRLGVWHLASGALVADIGTANGDPPQVYALETRPDLRFEPLAPEQGRGGAGAGQGGAEMERWDRVVTGGCSKHLKFWTIRTKVSEMKKLERGGKPVGDTAGTAEGQGARFADLGSSAPPPRKVLALCFATWDPNICFAGGDNGYVYLIEDDFRSPTARAAWRAHPGPGGVAALACSADKLFTGGGDGYCRAWGRQQLEELRQGAAAAAAARGGKRGGKGRLGAAAPEPLATYPAEPRALGKSEAYDHHAPSQNIFAHAEHRASIVPARPGTADSQRRLREMEAREGRPPAPAPAARAAPPPPPPPGPAAQLRAVGGKKATDGSAPGRVVGLVLLAGAGAGTGHTLLMGTTKGALAAQDEVVGHPSDLLRPRTLTHGHRRAVHGLAPHPLLEYVFATAGEDKELIIWHAQTKEILKRKTLDFPARMPAISPDGRHIAVAGLDSCMSVHTYSTLKKIAFRKDGPDGEEIDELKYSPDGKFLAVGNHDNIIYLYIVSSDYQTFRRLKGHTSYVTHVDWSLDSRTIMSNCGAYEILYWDANKAKQIRDSHDTIEADGKWAQPTAILGFPVMGIWPHGSDGTDVNSAHVSGCGGLLATGDDGAGVKLFNYPCVVGHAPHRRYHAHGGHVMNVRWLRGDTHLISVGGGDLAVLQWRCIKRRPPPGLRNEAPEDGQGAEDDEGAVHMRECLSTPDPGNEVFRRKDSKKTNK